MERIRAVTVDPSARGRLAVRDVAPPVPLPSEALVKVAAISLNRGEVRRSQAAEAGWRPGWDFAGQLRPHIEIEAPWSEIGEVARGLLDRRYPGKGVLHVAE